MCGICGFISREKCTIHDLKEMNATLAHRGPDDHGEEIYQLNSAISVGFAQRRLSIMDLSPRGHQPMHSNDRRVSVVFNGEIYNFKELRDELSGYSFKSDCDTEIIIAAYLEWGIGFCNKLEGMFAIAVLDRAIGKVYLIRDRMGKKPLYYYKDTYNNLVFASELKAICACPIFNKEIRRDIIGRFLYRTYITIPDTIYKNTFKLEPGSILKIDSTGIEKSKYWDVAQKYNELKKSSVHDYEEAKYTLKNLIRKSIGKRLIADVPVGAFLSGGYDSSLVCAVAQEVSDRPVKTFSIGFNDEKFNEAPYAKEVANHLGTEHTELYVSENDMINIIDSIPDYYDEPFADSSQIPSMLISRLAKENVSVALTGDGGDELFGGYGIYSVLQQVQNIEQGLEKAPNNNSIVDRILLDNDNPEIRTQVGVKTYLDVINRILIDKADNFYYAFESKYNEERYDIRRMLLDVEMSLSEDMLAKVDRASMRYALECRCPLLSRDIVEYSFRLSPDFKNRQGSTKRILKDITHEYIPRSIMERPKMGFAIPQDKWLRTVLKDRIIDWTNKDYLRNQGIFNADITQTFIQNYMKNGDQGKWSGHNFSRIVWSYFIFQQWYEEYMR